MSGSHLKQAEVQKSIIITGIFDEYLQKWVTDNKIDISPDILYMAGMAGKKDF